MFIFPSYVELQKKYLDAQHLLDETLKEKESLFAKTQPKSPKWDKIILRQTLHPFDEYLIVKEQEHLDERLSEAKTILEDREKMLLLKKAELYCSTHILDKVYRLHYLEGRGARRIADNLHFSQSQIYRVLSNVKKILRKQ